MGYVPEIVGWITIVALSAAALFLIGVVLWAYWPIALTLSTADQRKKRGQRKPRIDWRFQTGMTNDINALVGLSSRKKARWFFGLILFGDRDFDPELRTKIYTTPATPGADND